MKAKTLAMKWQYVLGVVVLLLFNYSYNEYVYGDRFVDSGMDSGNVVYINDYSSISLDKAGSDYGSTSDDDDNDRRSSNDVSHVTNDNDINDYGSSSSVTFETHDRAGAVGVSSRFS